MSNSIIGNFDVDGYVICRNIFTTEEIAEMRREIVANLNQGFQNGGGISIPDFLKARNVFPMTSSKKDSSAIMTILRDSIFNTTDFRFCGHNDIGVNRIVGWHKDKLNGEYAKYERTDIWSPGRDGGKQGIVKVLIYLQDHNGEDGTGLRIVPGSHIRRDYDTAGNFGVKLEIGDVLIFDQRMTHRGAERVLGGDQRILVSFGYGLNNAFTDDFEEGTLMRQEVQRRMTSAYINSKSGDVTMDSITQFIRGHPVTPEMLKNKIAGNINGRICHHRINVLQYLCSILDVRTYLELGVHNGSSMSYVVANNNSVKKSIGVDLFEDTISRYNADHLTVRRSYENIQKNNEGGNQVFLVKGSSQEENTKHTLVREMGNLEVDLMFIDADHEYAGVMKDLRIWTPLVRQGGMLVLDDQNDRYPGIQRAVNEFFGNNPEWRRIGIYDNNELMFVRR